MGESVKVCSTCKVKFNAVNSGVVGSINGKPVAMCSECCRKDG